MLRSLYLLPLGHEICPLSLDLTLIIRLYFHQRSQSSESWQLENYFLKDMEKNILRHLHSQLIQRFILYKLYMLNLFHFPRNQRFSFPLLQTIFL